MSDRPSEPTITVYTLPICPQCNLTKRWLDRAGATYTAIDLSTSPDDAAAVTELGYKQAPVIVVSNGDPETDIHWTGFNPDFLARYTGAAA